MCAFLLCRKAANGGVLSAEERKFLVPGKAADEFGVEEELLALTQDTKSRRADHWGPHDFDRDSHCLNVMVSGEAGSVGWCERKINA